MSTPETLLTRVLEADRALRDAREALLAHDDPRGAVRAIGREVDRAFESPASDEQAGARLIALSDLLVDLGGADAAQLLVKILGHDEPAVRVSAGEALVELLYDRYGEVARVLEQAVDKGGVAPAALAELPFILAEVGEQGGVKIVSKLLKHADADVVGAAIEGLAAMGDPSVIKQLEALRGDKRPVSMDDSDDPDAQELTVGELADEALAHLRELKRS